MTDQERLNHVVTGWVMFGLRFIGSPPSSAAVN